MDKFINTRILSEKISLTECTDGFWLWDETREMNLSMKAKSSEAALVEALEYYQTRLTTIETNYLELRAKVDTFVASFGKEGT